MTSKLQEVAAAIEALVVAALPGSDVARNRLKPIEIPAGGSVDLTDGEPGEPELDLSPLRYNYAHAFPLFFAAPETASLTAVEALDAMHVAVGAAVEADRTLGGLVDFLETVAPQIEVNETAGAASTAQSEAAIVAHYATSSPL